MKYNTTNLVEAYISQIPADKKPIAEALRAVIRKSALRLTECVKWDHPCYFFHGPVCFFDYTRSGVNLGFFRGKELEDPARLLTGSGNGYKHIKIRTLEDLQENQELISAMIREAVELNANHVAVPAA